MKTITPKTGLVLEGGAMRGLFSAGVMDVMMDHNIEFNTIIGVSAGAAFGCNYKSRQPGRAIRYNKRYANDPRFCSFKSLLKTGDLFGADFAYHEMPRTLDIFDIETYDKNPTEFYVVATDVDSGQPVYKRLDNGGEYAFEWIRASASLPLFSRMVKIDNLRFLDGGIADSIPLQWMEQSGITKNIVILTRPRGYRKGADKMTAIMKTFLWRHPHLAKALGNRRQVYNDQLDFVEQAEKNGRALVIAPPQPLPIGHVCHDPEVMQQVYEIGRSEAERLIPKISDFLLA